jgi:hypothetical protein
LRGIRCSSCVGGKIGVMEFLPLLASSRRFLLTPTTTERLNCCWMSSWTLFSARVLSRFFRFTVLDLDEGRLARLRPGFEGGGIGIGNGESDRLKYETVGKGEVGLASGELMGLRRGVRRLY